MREGLLGLVLTVVASNSVVAAQSGCIADCNGDATIGISELVHFVRLALMDGSVVECGGVDPSGDLLITVEEVVAAARTAAMGCPPIVTPTPSPSATPVVTATPAGVLFAGKISDLFPHALGDALIYRVTDGDETSTETDRVISADAQGVFVVQTQASDFTESRRYIDSIGQLRLDLIESSTDNIRTQCRPSLLIASVPLQVADIQETFSICEIRTVVGDRLAGSFRQDVHIEANGILAQVTVPAGTFTNVIHVSTRSVLTGATSGTEVHEIDLVPGVGLIRDVMRFGQTLRTRAISGGTIGGRPVVAQ